MNVATSDRRKSFPGLEAGFTVDSPPCTTKVLSDCLSPKEQEHCSGYTTERTYMTLTSTLLLGPLAAAPQWEPPSYLSKVVRVFSASIVASSLARLWEIKSLKLARLCRRAWKPLNRIAECEGITLSWCSRMEHWPRDIRFLFSSNDTNLSLIPLQTCALTVNQEEPFEPSTLKFVLQWWTKVAWNDSPLPMDCALHDLDPRISRRINLGTDVLTMARCYFEGGNVLAADDGQERVYIVGSSNLLATVLILGKVYRYPEKYSAPWMRKIQDRRQQLLDNNAFVYTDTQLREMLRYLWKLAKIPNKEVNEANEQFVHQLLAEFYIAQELFCEEFGAPCFFAGYDGFLKCVQLDFHIDMYILALPGGTVLLQDSSKCVEVLKEVLARPGLSDKLVKQFKQYLREARKQDSRESCQLDALERQMIDYGFKVLRVPGAYSTKAGRRVNYINSLVHVSGNDNRITLIVPDYNLPEEYFLRNAFDTSLQGTSIARIWKLVPEYSKKRKQTVFQRSLALDGSLHCRTIERYC